MLDWMEVRDLSFNSLLLLERVQISWLPTWPTFPKKDLAAALRANPCVEWYLRWKAPEISGWIDEVMLHSPGASTPEEVRAAEIHVMRVLNDLLVYVLDPAIYDAQPFMSWDPEELSSLVDFTGKIVIDIGSGTGRQAFIAGQKAAAVYAVEPVENLRRFIRTRAKSIGCKNVFTAEGLITEIPFPNGFADILTCGHVFGDHPEAELREMKRVVKPGGMVILIPGAAQHENSTHNYLVGQGFSWQEYIEPPPDILRKYWMMVR